MELVDGFSLSSMLNLCVCVCVMYPDRAARQEGRQAVGELGLIFVKEVRAGEG